MEAPATAASTSTLKPNKSYAVDDNRTPIRKFWTDEFRDGLRFNFPFELDDFQKRAIHRVHRNENVFVAAHTSAGKTAVAEYAIADALARGKRVFYTSPIKALSNQKFREFRQKFDGVGPGEEENVDVLGNHLHDGTGAFPRAGRRPRVGIVTGDVSLNPDADVLIVTTEILRCMLYQNQERHGRTAGRGAGADHEEQEKLISDGNTAWVIFDEIHYLNDYERGVVWEEVIILLPRLISMVFLSATVSNVSEFGEWLGRMKGRKLYHVSTDYRPTPLEHKLMHKGEVWDLLKPRIGGVSGAGTAAGTAAAASTSSSSASSSSSATTTFVQNERDFVNIWKQIALAEKEKETAKILRSTQKTVTFEFDRRPFGMTPVSTVAQPEKTIGSSAKERLDPKGSGKKGGNKNQAGKGAPGGGGQQGAKAKAKPKTAPGPAPPPAATDEPKKDDKEGDADKEQVIGYTVEKVNQSDFTKPAAKLGVKPGWQIDAVNDKIVSDLPLKEIQEILKASDLPVKITFQLEKVTRSKPGGMSGGAGLGGNRNNPYAKQENESQQLQILLRRLKEEDKLPATIFVFSRKKCVDFATRLPESIDFLTPNRRRGGIQGKQTTGGTTGVQDVIATEVDPVERETELEEQRTKMQDEAFSSAKRKSRPKVRDAFTDDDDDGSESDDAEDALTQQAAAIMRAAISANKKDHNGAAADGAAGNNEDVDGGSDPAAAASSANEKSRIAKILYDAFDARLSPADLSMPHILLTKSLAMRGIGVHHSGLLPIVKEVTEILFSQGLLKVLFATETFAMGVNMPARSVVFTQLEKHDGSVFRYLKPHEYTQMSGRAGRRGKDDRGFVYILAAGDKLPDKMELSKMMMSKVNPLKSQFRVTFKMLLSAGGGGMGPLEGVGVAAGVGLGTDHDAPQPEGAGAVGSFAGKQESVGDPREAPPKLPRAAASTRASTSKKLSILDMTAKSFLEMDRARHLPSKKKLIKQKEQEIASLSLEHFDESRKVLPEDHWLRLEEVYDTEHNCLLSPVDYFVLHSEMLYAHCAGNWIRRVFQGSAQLRKKVFAPGRILALRLDEVLPICQSVFLRFLEKTEIASGDGVQGGLGKQAADRFVAGGGTTKAEADLETALEHLNMKPLAGKNEGQTSSKETTPIGAGGQTPTDQMLVLVVLQKKAIDSLMQTAGAVASDHLAVGFFPLDRDDSYAAFLQVSPAHVAFVSDEAVPSAVSHHLEEIIRSTLVMDGTSIPFQDSKLTAERWAAENFSARTMSNKIGATASVGGGTSTAGASSVGGMATAASISFDENIGLEPTTSTGASGLLVARASSAVVRLPSVAGPASDHNDANIKTADSFVAYRAHIDAIAAEIFAPTGSTQLVPPRQLLDLRAAGMNKASSGAALDLELFQTQDKMKRLHALITTNRAVVNTSICIDHEDDEGSGSRVPLSADLFATLFHRSARAHQLRKEIKRLKYDTSEQSLYYNNQVESMAAFLHHLGYIEYDEEIDGNSSSCNNCSYRLTPVKGVFAAELLNSDEITLVEVLFEVLGEYLPDADTEGQLRDYYVQQMEGAGFGGFGQRMEDNGGDSDDDSDCYTSSESSAAYASSGRGSSFSDDSSDRESSDREVSSSGGSTSSAANNDARVNAVENSRKSISELKRRHKKPPPLAEFLRWVDPTYSSREQKYSPAFDFDPGARSMAARAVRMQNDLAAPADKPQGKLSLDPRRKRRADGASKRRRQREQRSKRRNQHEYSPVLDHPEFAAYLRQNRRIEVPEFCAFLSAFLGCTNAVQHASATETSLVDIVNSLNKGGNKSTDETPENINKKPENTASTASTTTTHYRLLPAGSPDFLHLLKRKLVDKHRLLEKSLEDDFGVWIEGAEWEKLCSPIGFATEAYLWASGISFLDLCDQSELQEGVLVRCLKSLEELLRKLKTLAFFHGGMTSLELLAMDCITAVKRDIVFMPSLYLE
eukprot:g8470.t1